MPVRETLRAVAGLGATVALVLAAVAAPATAAKPAPAADHTPPSQPTGFTATAITTTTSVTFTWNPSTDNVGVMSYSLWAEGLGLGVVSVPHPQTTGSWTLGLRPGTTYTFGVQAWDATYNGSAVSWLNVTTLPDVTAPTTPGNLRVDAVSASKVLINWTSATDDVGPVTYEVLVNGVPSPNVWSTVTPGTFPRPATQGGWVRQLDPGTAYEFAVRARDGSGNVSATSNVVTATTLANPDGVAPTTPTLTRADSGGTGACPEELWAAWTAATDDTDPASAIEYELRINGVINEVIPGGTQTITYTEVLGANTVTIVAVDPAGNASAPSNAITVTTNWGFGGCAG